jgi:hypothetical protein
MSHNTTDLVPHICQRSCLTRTASSGSEKLIFVGRGYFAIALNNRSCTISWFVYLMPKCLLTWNMFSLKSKHQLCVATVRKPTVYSRNWAKCINTVRRPCKCIKSAAARGTWLPQRYKGLQLTVRCVLADLLLDRLALQRTWAQGSGDSDGH